MIKIKYKDANGIITPKFAALQYGGLVLIGIFLMLKSNLDLSSTISFVLFSTGLSCLWIGGFKLDRYFLGIIE